MDADGTKQGYDITAALIADAVASVVASGGAAPEHSRALTGAEAALSPASPTSAPTASPRSRSTWPSAACRCGRSRLVVDPSLEGGNNVFGVVGIPGILVMPLAAAFWLLKLAAVVYVFWLLREFHHGLRKLQTDVEELRREFERSRK
jgi:hypothetical protein